MAQTVLGMARREIACLGNEVRELASRFERSVTTLQEAR